MDSNSRIKWREASEDEYAYIKKKYAGPTAALLAGMIFMLLLMFATLAFMIYCNIKNHSAGAVAASLFMYPLMLFFIVMVIFVAAIDIRRLNSFYGRKIRVSDATVQNVNVQMGTRGRTHTRIQFMTSTNVHISMRSTGLKPLAEKGKHALILSFGKADRKDWQYVIKEG